MKTNKQLLSKQDFIQKMVSLPAITLEAEEADRFIDYMVDESVLMKNVVRVVRMKGPTKNVRALGVGTGRFLRPGATFSSSDYLKQLAQNKIQLVTKKVRGCVGIFDDDLEDVVSIESGVEFKTQVMRMVAAKIANELEEAAYMTLKTGSWWDIPNISQQLRGLKEINNGVIKGVPLTLMRGDQEIMAPIGGKKVRVTKSLISIKADSDWVAARIQADRLAAFPEHIAKTMLEPGNAEFTEPPKKLPPPTETAPEGEIVEGHIQDAVEEEIPAGTHQEGQGGKEARPYNAQKLKERIKEMIATYDNYLNRDPAKYSVTLKTDQQVIAAVVGKNFDDGSRYAIFAYLLGEGKGSTKTWDAYETGAIKNLWLNIVNFDDELAGVELQEIMNVWNAAQISQGQMEAF